MHPALSRSIIWSTWYDIQLRLRAPRWICSCKAIRDCLIFHCCAKYLDASCLRILPTERWVESLHASSKRNLTIATRHSPLHLAWKTVAAKVTGLILRDNNELERLASYASCVRSPCACLEQMFFLYHPDVQEKINNPAYSKRALSCRSSVCGRSVVPCRRPDDVQGSFYSFAAWRWR